LTVAVVPLLPAALDANKKSDRQCEANALQGFKPDRLIRHRQLLEE
jgi:hypothetical protein